MQARILNPAEEHLWEEFVLNHSLGNIHQTPEWGHFQSKVPGRGKYWIVILTGTGQTYHNSNLSQSSNHPTSHSDSKILAGTLLTRHQLPGGYCWLYAARGPLLNYDSKDDCATVKNQMNALLSEIKKIARQEKAIFLRVDPLIRLSSTTESCTHDVHTNDSQRSVRFPHFRQNISGFQPDHTLVLDLTRSEEELLAQMKPKGRYNIKLAEKKGVTIRTAGLTNGSGSFDSVRFEKDLAAFYKILTETTSRDGFHGHDLEFYRNMLESLQINPKACNSLSRVSPNQDADYVNYASAATPQATLYLAEFDDQIIAACLNTFYKDTATYYYGASSDTYRNVMAPYFLHWQAIRDAKQKGYKFYDFFGIAPTREHSECASQQTSPEAKMNPHPWAGVTEFKKKFGGTEISYQKPQEFPFIKSIYLLYCAYKKLKT